MHDLILKGGTVFDGADKPGRVADVRLADGKIVGIVFETASPFDTPRRMSESSTNCCNNRHPANAGRNTKAQDGLESHFPVAARSIGSQ